MSASAPSASVNRVRLRDAQQADLPIFFEHQRDPDANRMAAFPPRDREAFMAHWRNVLADETAIKQAVLFDGVVAGNIVSWETQGRREVGYWIGKEFWGKSIASNALTQFLVQVTGRPLHAHVAKHNAASIRVLEKCGFKFTGEDKCPSQAGGEPVEEFIMSLH